MTIRHIEDELGISIVCHEDTWKSFVGKFLGLLLINILCGDFVFSLLSLFYYGTAENENKLNWVKQLSFSACRLIVTSTLLALLGKKTTPRQKVRKLLSHIT